MRVYAEDSVKKLAETKAHAMKLCARLESDLSEEDFRNLNACEHFITHAHFPSNYLRKSVRGLMLEAEALVAMR